MASSKNKKAVIKNVKKVDITRADLEKTLDLKRVEICKRIKFVEGIKKTIEIESKKISALEGAILTLQEILKSEKGK